MRSNFLHWCRTSSYLLGTVFFLWLGYRVQKYLVILEDNLDNNMLLVLRESPYLSLSFPLWCANLIAGVVLFCTLLLVVPVIGALRQRLLHFAIFFILLLICVLPLHVHFDAARFNFEKLFFHSYHLILGGIGITLCFRGLVGAQFSNLHTFPSRFFHWIRNLRSRPFVMGAFIGCLLTCGSISWHIFDGVPGFIDSCIYMFQARLFAHGMLTAPIPSEPEFFGAAHTILSDKWYTVYPPRYPAILALGVLFGISWLINPLLGALTIVCIYLLAKELYGDTTAKLSAILACASSFFFSCLQNLPHILQRFFS